ncbi:MAG: elongation factor P, partial [Gammaproteobacteria bacterium]|nr:elongation factor P [Gammaproteobacteria bacterium]
MPAISTNDLKNGITLNLDGTLYTVVEFQHVKPGKGGAFVRSRLRNLRSGNMLDRTFNAGVKVEQAILEKRDMQFLYKDGDEYVFMDTETYDQVNIKPVALGEAADYLIENAVAIIATYEGEIVSVEIPAAVELEIAQTEPGIQGDRVSG